MPYVSNVSMCSSFYYREKYSQIASWNHAFLKFFIVIYNKSIKVIQKSLLIKDNKLKTIKDASSTRLVQFDKVYYDWLLLQFLITVFCIFHDTDFNIRGY